MATIVNPILPGFNPDPAFCRVGEDYYIATSTFEWFPGVQIHHSRDLVHWRLAGRPLTRAAQLDMRGDPDSCGVWAPALTYADGLFWLIYTDVKRRLGNFKDAHNYLVTAPAIDGPWSDRVAMNSSGFDPSLFHDDDGRKWFLNMVWDHRRRFTSFGGILLQEFSVAEQRLVGPIKNIFRGSPLGLVEGPHLSKRDGWYYLTVAEGGTGYNHAVTMARSRTIDGPYELHPDHHIITAKDAPDAPLQRAGHGFYVETPAGEVYHTHLCSRPLPDTQTLAAGARDGPAADGLEGRRLALSRGRGRPGAGPRGAGARPAAASLSARARSARLRRGEPSGRLPVAAQPRLAAVVLPRRTPRPPAPVRAGIHRQLVRAGPRGPPPDIVGVRGRDRSRFPSRRLSATRRAHLLLRQGAPALPRRLGGRGREPRAPGDLVPRRLSRQHPDLRPRSGISRFPDGRPVHLGVDVDQGKLQFRWSADGTTWQAIGPVLDASMLSDEAGPGAHGSFTGAFVGMAAHDLSGRGLPADFDYFSYRDL